MLSWTDVWWVQTLVQRRNHHSLCCLCLWWNSCHGAGLLLALCILLQMTSKAPSTFCINRALYTEKYIEASWRDKCKEKQKQRLWNEEFEIWSCNLCKWHLTTWHSYKFPMLCVHIHIQQVLFKLTQTAVWHTQSCTSQDRLRIFNKD